jgi:hypothetical protein
MNEPFLVPGGGVTKLEGEGFYLPALLYHTNHQTPTGWEVWRDSRRVPEDPEKPLVQASLSFSFSFSLSRLRTLPLSNRRVRDCFFFFFSILFYFFPSFEIAKPPPLSHTHQRHLATRANLLKFPARVRAEVEWMSESVEVKKIKIKIKAR